MARRILTFCEVFILVVQLIVFVLCMIITLFAGMRSFILETIHYDELQTIFQIGFVIGRKS